MFFNRLKEARIKAGFTQGQVAEMLGIAKSTYSGYETGNSEPSMNTISRLMRIYSVSADWLWQDEMADQSECQSSDTEMHLSNDEIELIRIYRTMNRKGKDMLMCAATGFAGNPNMQKDGSIAEMA